jgi:hypothetical protein
MPMRARRITLDESLRDGVAAKDRYGRLTLPLVVAIQVIEEFRIDKIDVMNGLLGPEAITFDDDGQPRDARVPSGAWISGNGPIHRTISAVVAWSTLEPWNFTRIEPILVHNPYASNPLPSDILPVTQNVVDHQNEVLVEQPGISMEALLGLPKDWVTDD